MTPNLTPDGLRALILRLTYPDNDNAPRTEGLALVAAWQADRRKLEALAFEAQGYLDVVNRQKPDEESAHVSVGFIRRSALAAGEEKPSKTSWDPGARPTR